LSWRLQPLQLLHRPVQLRLPGHELMQGGAVPPPCALSMQSCETDGAERQQSTPRKLLDSPAGMNSSDQSQSQPAKSVCLLLM
jgi:hypothetical protein